MLFKYANFFINLAVLNMYNFIIKLNLNGVQEYFM